MSHERDRMPRPRLHAGFLRVALLVAGTLVLAPRAQAAGQNLSLQSGWNLISFAVAPSNPAPAAVFGALGSNFQAVWTYDAAVGQWRTYPAPTASIPAISVIEPGRGYWVKVGSSAPLPVEASDVELPDSPPDLVTGWNLVGFAVEDAIPWNRVLGNLSIQKIWKYDAVARQFRGVQRNTQGAATREDFPTLDAGVGYWVFASQPVSLAPQLGTALPPDVDQAPLLPTGPPDARVLFASFTPGDADVGSDGFYDRPPTQRAVAMGEDLEQQNFSIFNQAGGVLAWSAVIVDPEAHPWLRVRREVDGDVTTPGVEAVSGSLTTETADLELLVDRTGLPPGDYQADLLIQSNGESEGFPYEPARTIHVSMSVAELDGDYEVRAEIDRVNGKRADTANPRLFLSIWRDVDGTKAAIDDTRTLLFPRKLRMSGGVYQDETTKITVSGSFELPAGHPDNPYDAALRREVTLRADRRGPGPTTLGPLDLQGQYFETIRNVLSNPIYLEGTFTATRLGGTPTALDVLGPSNGLSESIPDNGVLESEIEVTESISISELDVTVNIDHPRPADLVVTLLAPGTCPTPTNPAAPCVALLRNRLEAPAGELTYDESATPVDPLDFYDGRLSPGTWKLRIEDKAVGQAGDLVAWSLSLKGTRLNSIRGSVAGVGAGASVLLTGCGQSRTATTVSVESQPTSGAYRFDDLIDCLYRLTVHKSGFERAWLDVSLNGTDLTNQNLSPSTAPADPEASCATQVPLPSNCPYPPVPSTTGLRFVSLTTQGGAGALLPQPELRYAADAATFDIDRPPIDPQAPGPEDSNSFLQTENPTTKSNRLGVNSRIDDPVGANSRKLRLTLGQPTVGASVQGPYKLQIGASR
jgi:subtilisin-like proprotein convertase family protein